MLYLSRVDIIEHGPFVDDVPINWVIFQRYVSLSGKKPPANGEQKPPSNGFLLGNVNIDLPGKFCRKSTCPLANKYQI